MSITPSPFMLLEATPDTGTIHFVASAGRGQVQISGRGDRWGTSEKQSHWSETRVLGGVYRTPADAAAELGRRFDLEPYRQADVYCQWREREARRRLAAPMAYGLDPDVATHAPLAPAGYTLSTDWAYGKYRFYATTEAGRASVGGVGTHWSAAVVDVADPTESRVYGMEFVTPEEAAAALADAGHEASLWDRAADQRRRHPDMIPLRDEHGDTLWVVDRDRYYRLTDLAAPERAAPAPSRGFRVL